MMQIIHKFKMSSFFFDIAFAQARLAGERGETPVVAVIDYKN